MAQIQGTVLAAKISPGDTSATFPTHEDIYGKGGLMSVQTLSELSTDIPADRQKVGMMIYVADTSSYYTLTSVSYPLTSFSPVSQTFSTRNYTHANFVPLTGNATISGPLQVNNNLVIYGNLSATGTANFANTIFSTTTALSVSYVGSGTALWVGSRGTGDIASFYDVDAGVEVLHVAGHDGSTPGVGIYTSTPNKTLTVNGEISASGIIWDATGNSNNWNNAYTTINSNSATWTKYDYINSNFLNLTGGTVTGEISAIKYYGDGSALTGIIGGGSSTITTATSTNLTGFIYGNGTSISAVPDAPSDNKYYVRRNTQWVELTGAPPVGNIPINTTVPSVVTLVDPGTPLETDNGAWSNEPILSYRYQWQTYVSNVWQDISGATNASFNGHVENGTYRAAVWATNSSGESLPAYTTGVTVPQIPLYNEAIPIIQGIAFDGSTLTTDEGGWNQGGLTVNFQWQKSTNLSNWENINGATSDSFLITNDLIGYYLRSKVDATSIGGAQGTVYSDPTSQVGMAVPYNIGLPIMGGTQADGFSVANNGSWLNGPILSHRYQWQRAPFLGEGVYGEWVNINGQTSNSFYPYCGIDQAGVGVRVAVWATNDVGESNPAYTNVDTVFFVYVPYNISPPTIQGSTELGSVVSVDSDGVWRCPIPGPFLYQWQKSLSTTGGWEDINNATNSSLLLTSDLFGYYVRLGVIAPGYMENSPFAYSAASSIISTIKPYNIGEPTIQGSTGGGFSVASNGSWLNGPILSYRYEWQTEFENYGFVVASTGSTFPASCGYSTTTLRLAVWATSELGEGAPAYSAITDLTNINPINTALPTIDGVASVGYSLYVASNGSWNCSNENFTYQWQKSLSGADDWENIGGATGGSLWLAPDLENYYIRVSVTTENSQNGFYDLYSSAESAASGLVDSPFAVLISNGNVTFGSNDPEPVFSNPDSGCGGLVPVFGNNVATSITFSNCATSSEGFSFGLAVPANKSFTSLTDLTFFGCGGFYGTFSLADTGGLTAVTTLSFDSCGYYDAFYLTDTGGLTAVTTLSFINCGYSMVGQGQGLFYITDVSGFTALTTLTINNSGHNLFHIVDSVNLIPEAKALIILNAVANGVDNGIGNITLHVTGTSTLLAVKATLEGMGYAVTLTTP